MTPLDAVQDGDLRAVAAKMMQADKDGRRVLGFNVVAGFIQNGVAETNASKTIEIVEVMEACGWTFLRRDAFTLGGVAFFGYLFKRSPEEAAEAQKTMASPTEH